MTRFTDSPYEPMMTRRPEGGGIMEYHTQQLARELLEPGAAPCRLAAFTTEGASDAAAIAACGGSMKVFLQRLEPEG